MRRLLYCVAHPLTGRYVSKEAIEISFTIKIKRMDVKSERAYSKNTAC